jgi:hypothetical protein
MECQYCNKILSTVYSLKTHQKTVKSCLQKQGKQNDIVNFNCKFCSKSFTSKDNLYNHYKICKEKMKEDIITDEVNKIKEEHKLELEKRNKEHRKELDKRNKEHRKELEKRNKEQSLEIKILKENHSLEIIKLKEELCRLQGKLSVLEENKDIIYEIAKQPKITNANTNNNKILSINSYMDFNNTEHVKKLIEEKYDTKYLFQGQKGVAQFAVDYILKDDNGDLRYVCTDPSRQIFKYKDSEGCIKKDVEAKKLTGFLVNSGIQNKTHNVAIDFWTEDDGEINGEKCSTLLETAQSVKNIAEDNTVFKKELVNITCV